MRTLTQYIVKLPRSDKQTLLFNLSKIEHPPLGGNLFWLEGVRVHDVQWPASQT